MLKERLIKYFVKATVIFLGLIIRPKERLVGSAVYVGLVVAPGGSSPLGWVKSELLSAEPFVCCKHFMLVFVCSGVRCK